MSTSRCTPHPSVGPSASPGLRRHSPKAEVTGRQTPRGPSQSERQPRARPCTPKGGVSAMQAARFPRTLLHGEGTRPGWSTLTSSGRLNTGLSRRSWCSPSPGRPRQLGATLCWPRDPEPCLNSARSSRHRMSWAWVSLSLCHSGPRMASACQYGNQPRQVLQFSSSLQRQNS